MKSIMIGEKKMKKALAIILSICFVLCLTACNKEETSSENQIGEPIHTHNFSNATCIQPKMCSFGAVEGEPINHELVNGLCKYCSQAIIINPKNIDFSHKFEIYKTYSGEETYYQDLLYTYIDFNEKYFNEDFYDKVTWSVEKTSANFLEYQNNLYSLEGHSGYKFNYEITDEKILITFLAKPELELHLQAYSNGTIRVLQTSKLSKLEKDDILK